MDSRLGSSGVVLKGVCPQCDGDGKLATTDRAACFPEKHPAELVVCSKCDGVGGDTPEAGERGRAASEAYMQALFGNTEAK